MYGMTCSKNHNIGTPSSRNTVSRATISDSVDECETTVWPLQSALIGAKVFFPTRAMKAPMVDLEVRLSPAQSASEYTTSLHSLLGSPTMLIRLWS